MAPPGPAGPLIDLNADLGEGGPADGPLLEVVSSANVACGFHAGGPETMLETCRLAALHGVRVGAHPSYADREGFGRRDISVAPSVLVAELTYQIGALQALARSAGTEVAYVKLHGAVYNRAAVDADTADAVLEALTGFDTPPALLGLAGSVLLDRARDRGVAGFTEGFADRAYASDGTLVPRSEPGAVITNPEAVVAQARDLVRGCLRSASGEEVPVRVDSICLHGDTPGALDLARAVRGAIEADGVAVRAFA